jgi:MFS family permease
LKTKEAGSGRRWPTLLFVMSGVFLSTMDSGMQNLALPSMMEFFALGFEKTELIVTVYLLTIAATLIFWGKFSDRIGRGRIYIAGIGVFALGAFCCFSSTDFLLLLVSRFIQALGAAMMMSAGPAIIKESFPGSYLGRSLGLVGIATAGGLLAGPFISGQLLVALSWRSVFLVSTVVGCLIFVVGLCFMGRYLPPQARQPGESSFDLPGGCCWVLICCLIIAILHRLDRLLSLSSVSLVVLLLGVVGFFIFWEKRNRNPIVPILLLRNSYYSIAVVTATISFAVLFAVLVLIPFYLEYIMEVPVSTAGVVMMAVPASLMVLSPLSGYLYDRIGAKILTSSGLLVSFFAVVALAFLKTSSSLNSLAVVMAILGAGQSIFLAPNSASVLSRVEDQYLATTAGVLATARNFGMVAGATVAASLFSFLYGYFSGGGELNSYRPENATTFMLALKISFAGLSLLALTGAAISLLRD